MKHPMVRNLAIALSLAALFGMPTHAEDLRIIALGDMPYGQPDEVYGPYEALIGEINARRPDLVIHIGDTKSGGTACTDEILDDQLGFLESFDAPTLYTPGDNEWTDCHRGKAGGFDPIERLQYIRETYFGKPKNSFGKTRVKLKHQGKDGYPENARMMLGDIGFITAHVVGSNNNFEVRDLEAVKEFFKRDKATEKWLTKSFGALKDAEAMIVAIHADMFEFDFNMFGRERWLRHSGFRNFGTALKEAAARFGKPVLLIFGDSHRFRFFQPFPQTAPNIQALEVFGGREMHAVEVIVDHRSETVFSVETVINPAL